MVVWRGAAAPAAPPSPSGVTPPRPPARWLLAGGLLLAAALPASLARDAARPQDPPAPDPAQAFVDAVWPLVDEYCVSCHGEDKQKAGLRLDTLDYDLRRGPDAATWKKALDLVRLGDMPRGRVRPSDEERAFLEERLHRELVAAAAVREPDRGVLRRLTRRQYTASLQELLGVGLDFGKVLPEDAASARGFRNEGASQQASPLHLETYQDIARAALDEALMLGPPPEVVRYRVDFGAGRGAGAVAATTGGYQSVPLATDDFRITVLDAEGRPRTGATEAERAALDALRRRISVGLRGSSQDRFHVVDEGLMLYSALPHREVPPGSWQGPSPNLKLELQRVFPDHGPLRMDVTASRGYLVRGRKELLVDLEDPVPRAAVVADADPAEPSAAERLAMQPAAFGEWHRAGPFDTASGAEARRARFVDPAAGVDLAAALPDGSRWQPAGGADGEIERYPDRVGVVYLAQVVEAPSPRTVELSLGSDDALWVWLNGRRVLSRDVQRGAAPDQDQVALELVAGRNEIVLEIVNDLGGFASYHRLVHDGTSAGPLPYELSTPPGARVLAAERADQRENLRFEGGLLVPDEVPEPARARLPLDLPEGGYFQFDLVHPALPPEAMGSVRFAVDAMRLDTRPRASEAELAAGFRVTALGAGWLNAGRHEVVLGGPFFTGFGHLVVTPLAEDHPLVRRLESEAEQLAQQQVPALRAYAGTRTDDGMDYLPFGESVAVEAPLEAPQVYTFRARLEDLPLPEPESGDTEILSGFSLFGVWNDHLVKSRDQTGPPLLVHAIEITAPEPTDWPPASRRRILLDGPLGGDEEAYAAEVVSRFAARAFRRPLADDELARYLAFWRGARAGAGLEESLREVLVAVLCSPNFLYLEEDSLASRLAYFLWDGPPDAELLALDRAGGLRGRLAEQTDRMLDDPRAARFLRTFTREWLRLERFEGMSLDVGRFPAYTRFVQADMAEETYRFVERVFREDLPLTTLVDADFTMLNQNLAEFYGIPGVEGTAFRPVPLPAGSGRGGLLGQGSFLVGHSDGREAHPIKRAVWIKRRILGAPPVAPPPNVPDLESDEPGFDQLTLKQRIERHRDQPSCYDCHAGFDAYGFAFEGFDASGRPLRGAEPDDSSVLPDGTPVDGVADLKAWILGPSREVFARSVIDHLWSYALGREPGVADYAATSAVLDRLGSEGWRARAVVHGIVSSPAFLDPAPPPR